jgi:hypothetical protein
VFPMFAILYGYGAGYSGADWLVRLGAVVGNPPFIALAFPLVLLVVLGFAAGRPAPGRPGPADALMRRLVHRREAA